MKRNPIFIPRKNYCPYENSFGYIYLITNSINGHKYIGKHVYRHPFRDTSYWASGGSHLQNALKKLNGDKSKFTYEILEWVELTENCNEVTLAKKLSDLEKYFIYWFGTFISKSDYNETAGGDSWESGELNPMYKNHRFAGENHPMYGVKGKDNPRYGMKHTLESRLKMSKSAKGKHVGEKNNFYGVHMFGEQNPFFGKHHSQETKDKISKANKGKGYRITGEKNGMFGKHHTLESRKKMSASRSGKNNYFFGKHHTEESKLKNRLAHLGKKATDEHKQLLKDMWGKPISQYSADGALIQQFNYGALSIGRNFKLKGKLIYESCCKNDFSLVEGYRWRFTEIKDKSKEE